MLLVIFSMFVTIKICAYTPLVGKNSKADTSNDGALSPSQIQLTDSYARSGEQINWQVIATGGNCGSSANYVLCATAGQTAVGIGSSSSLVLRSGFWQSFGSVNCCLAWGNAGDANSDEAINLLDILWVIEYVYQDPPGHPPNPGGCDALLDVNGDGLAVNTPTINLLDILALIEHVYQEPVGTPTLCCPPGCLVP